MVYDEAKMPFYEEDQKNREKEFRQRAEDHINV